MQQLTKFFIIVAHAQRSSVNVYVTKLIFFLPHRYVFVLELRESLLKSPKITLKKIVKSILRCRKTINSPKNPFWKK